MQFGVIGRVSLYRSNITTMRKEIFAYVKEEYNIEPDYPWARTPDCAILRHRHNRKWFAAILVVQENKLVYWTVH